MEPALWSHSSALKHMFGSKTSRSMTVNPQVRGREEQRRAAVDVLDAESVWVTTRCLPAASSQRAPWPPPPPPTPTTPVFSLWEELIIVIIIIILYIWSVWEHGSEPTLQMLLWHCILPNYQVTLAAGQSEGAVTGPKSFEVPPGVWLLFFTIISDIIVSINSFMHSFEPKINSFQRCSHLQEFVCWNISMGERFNRCRRVYCDKTHKTAVQFAHRSLTHLGCADKQIQLNITTNYDWFFFLDLKSKIK